MVPDTEEFLNHLYRMKREALAEIADAEQRKDSITARAFQKHLAKLDVLIQRKGGDPECAL